MAARPLALLTATASSLGLIIDPRHQQRQASRPLLLLFLKTICLLPPAAFFANHVVTYILDLGLFSNSRSIQSDNVVPSPLQRESLGRSKDLPYPPDMISGARDVNSPHGTIRVYEWGPEDGRKVLLIHGISTPCIALYRLAELLTDNGCRVMLYDLYGRGYSSTPNPRFVKQDAQLFTTQILTVLASSPISWTGSSSSFTLVGYSLGGGISAAFTSNFPYLVDTLVLIAPSGLLRPKHISWTSKLLYRGGLPNFITHNVIRRRLRGTPSNQTQAAESDSKGSANDTVPSDASEVEHPALAPNAICPIHPSRPAFSVADVVNWQLDHHPGFLESFISSIRYGPITDQHEKWAVIGRRLAAQRALQASQGLLSSPAGNVEDSSRETRAGALASSDSDPSALPADSMDESYAVLHRNNGGNQIQSSRDISGSNINRSKDSGRGPRRRRGLQGRVLLLLGKSDGVIVADEVAEDARAVLGEDNVDVQMLDGGHEVPITHSKDVANAIMSFWKEQEQYTI